MAPPQCHLVGQRDYREGAILGLMELLTGKLSKQDFAKKFTKELQASSPCEVQFDEAQFGLRVAALIVDAVRAQSVLRDFSRLH